MKYLVVVCWCASTGHSKGALGEAAFILRPRFLRLMGGPRGEKLGWHMGPVYGGGGELASVYEGAG